MLLVELDLLDPEQPSPLRLIAENLPEFKSRVLLAEVDIDRLPMASLDERVETHRRSLTASGSRAFVQISRSPKRSFNDIARLGTRTALPAQFIAGSSSRPRGRHASCRRPDYRL